MATGTTGTGSGSGSGKSKWMWLAKLAGALVVVFLAYGLLVYHQTHMIVESVGQAVGHVMTDVQRKEDGNVFSLQFGPDGKGEGYIKFHVQGSVEDAQVKVVPTDGWRAASPQVVVQEAPPAPPTPPETPVTYERQQRQPPDRHNCLACHHQGPQYHGQRTAARPVVTHWVGRDLQP